MNYKQRYKNMPIDKSWTIEKDRERFINEIAELAFGEGAIERGYDMQEVIDQLKSLEQFQRISDDEIKKKLKVLAYSDEDFAKSFAILVRKLALR